MNQKEFDTLAFEALKNSLPILKDAQCSYSESHIDIKLPSNKKNLTLLISTRDKGITIGSGINNLFGEHIHMDQLGAKTPQQMINVAIKLIDDLVNDKIRIISNQNNSYTIDLDSYLFRELGFDNDENNKSIIEYTFWSKI